jgi:glycine cleavage system H protein
MIPEDLLYTTDHEWVRRTGDVVRIGITDFAQSALGDIVYVSPPEVGASLGSGATLGEIESTKSVSDVYAPVTGEVVGRNDALDEQPELVNSDPYGAGWLAEIRVGDADGPALLTPAEYAAHIAQQG